VRILITGVGGFVGRHLLRHLREINPSAEFHGSVIEDPPPLIDPALTCHTVNLKAPDAVLCLLEEVQPTHIYHLAAQASPRLSFEIPWETLENNIRSQLNIIQSCLTLGIAPRMLVVSSAEIYGPVRPEDQPLNEETPLRPANPYGVSKVAQDLIGLQYHLSHHLPILRARPFNHLGPGQREGFVAVDFAIQIARIEAGQQHPEMHVGNLSAQRDFTDVRDVVRAYGLIMERGTPGEAYNIATGVSISIEELLKTMLTRSTTPITIRTDPSRFLPLDIPIIRGDATRLYNRTGWRPVIPLQTTIDDVMTDCRERVRRMQAASRF
jgi:GDP-4-dehydro-6-deoxy-D-mannose reductase